MPAKAALGAIAEFFQAAATKMAETPLAQAAPESARAIRQQATAPTALAQPEHVSPQPAPAKNAEPVKLPAAPKVAIAGPERGTPGAMPVFTANVVGRYDALKWAVTPNCEGLLILADPRQCTFGNDEPGEYTIRCTVSGGRQIAECECVYQIVAVGQSPALIEGVPKPARNQLPLLQNSPPNNLSERVIEQINKVQTAARAPEAHALGACFRDAANRFDTGQVAPDADIAVEVFRCAKAGLGDPTVARWKPFFEWTALELAMLRQAGLSPSGFLNQVAIVMSQVQ